MSNSQSNRPRRSFATGSVHSSRPQQAADELRYDGDEVPVLIRLPDLSPQALLRAPAATAATHVAAAKVVQASPPVKESPVKKPPVNTQAGGTSELSPPSLEAGAPEAPPTAAAARSVAASPQGPPIPGTSYVAEPKLADAQVGRSTGDQANDEQSDTSNPHSTPATGEGSPQMSRRRKRSGPAQGGPRADQAQLASPPGSHRGASAKTASATDIKRQDQHILAFDQSRLLIGAGLVVVAALTYFALRGGGEDPANTAGTWAGGEPGSVLPTSDQNPQPEVDLWPGNQSAQVSPEEATTADPAASSAEQTAPTATATNWPAEPQQQSPAAYEPAEDYSYSAPPIIAPANGQNDSPPDYAVPNREAPTAGWPTETSIPVQPASATLPVQTWPDAAKAEPTTNAPSRASQSFYPSQAAGYTTPPATAGGYGETSAVRTGRLETTGSYSDGPVLTAENPGSQLNGTIEIPRPRANNEYNGSNVY